MPGYTYRNNDMAKKIICMKAEETPAKRLFHGVERIIQTSLAQLESLNFRGSNNSDHMASGTWTYLPA